jgi:hypothetical protein
MAKHILIYSIAGYPEEGAGTYFEDNFKDESDLTNRINKLSKEHKELLNIDCAGFLSAEYNYEAVEYVKEYKRV